ncbi:M3 family oligoendopeptidase [Armatimonas sp.]|uniref:M3 family oligoendopeptidase n=1 Tax=Armatimonas sp. TaxID=1872638 RepID=UPI00286BD7FA|nr:M3 family oligoendopeptidase [Armatimonas sp.]
MTSTPSWNLTDLFQSPDDPRLLDTLTLVSGQAIDFATHYQGKIATLTAAALAEALATYERLHQEGSKPATYAGLRFAADTAPENGAQVQKLREKTTAALLPTLFFPIELARLDGKQLETLAAAPELTNWRRYLLQAAKTAPFSLSEPEEKVLAQKANTGNRAWVRLFQELLSNLRFDFEGKSLSLSEISTFQYHTDREQRRQSAEALTQGLRPHLRTFTYIYNTLVQDKALEDGLRGYAFPEQSRHLSNELTPEIVAAVTDTAEAGYPTVGRYYKAKQKLLGLDSLTHYDRYAPLHTDEPSVSFDEARDDILAAFARFEPSYATAGQAFFDGGWIDATPRPGKQGGAFCSYITPDLHPYLFQSYLNRASDKNTLAHELGHGIHSSLSRGQSFLNFYGTLPMAEVASTFAELLVFEQEQERTTGAARRALFGRVLEDSFSTIHRQTAMYRFEQAVHTERKQGELSAERISALWQEKMSTMFAGAVTLGEEHALWWSYIPHLIGTPFYVYAYSFGKMLALALYFRYQQEGTPFAQKYVAMLSKGGSQFPAELVAPLGVDLSDPSFWQGALEILESWVTEFERTP